jgi:hypothetical protein
MPNEALAILLGIVFVIIEELRIASLKDKLTNFAPFDGDLDGRPGGSRKLG